MRYDHIKMLRKEIARVLIIGLVFNLVLTGVIIGIVIRYEHIKKSQEEQMRVMVRKLQMIDDIQKNIMFYRLPSLPEEETAEIEAQGTKLTAADKELITRVCMAEAGTDYDGCLAVAQCIYDRSVLWNRTPYEVVSAYKQFAQPRQGDVYPESARAVTDVFEKGVMAFENSNVTHFFSGEDVPYWVEGKEFVGEMGGNKFFI